MDPELTAYFDQRFREMTLHTEGLHQETRQEIKTLREEMNRRLQQLDERMGRVEGRLAQVEDRVGRVEDEVHQAHISVEGLRGDSRLVAEGVMSNEEKLGVFREEVNRKLDEIRTMNRLSYDEVSSRVRRLEIVREREGRDPLDLIREKFGKRPGET